MSATGIKGAAFESAVADILRLVDERRLTRGELEARLTIEDLGVLDVKVQPAQWYPLDTYGRLTEMLLRTEGGGRIEYLLERGRNAARRLEASGVYSQISATEKTWGARVGDIMASLGPAMFRNTEWVCRINMNGEEMRGFEVALSVSEDFPDICRHAIQGFIGHLAGLAVDMKFRIGSRRASPSEILITGRTVRR